LIITNLRPSREISKCLDLKSPVKYPFILKRGFAGPGRNPPVFVNDTEVPLRAGRVPRARCVVREPAWSHATRALGALIFLPLPPSAIRPSRKCQRSRARRGAVKVSRSLTTTAIQDATPTRASRAHSARSERSGEPCTAPRRARMLPDVMAVGPSARMTCCETETVPAVSGKSAGRGRMLARPIGHRRFGA
jgi:hypothetical protein